MHAADKPVQVVENMQVSLYVLAHGFHLHRLAGLELLRKLFIVSTSKNKQREN